jgi:hypothetical protein
MQSSIFIEASLTIGPKSSASTEVLSLLTAAQPITKLLSIIREIIFIKNLIYMTFLASININI